MITKGDYFSDKIIKIEIEDAPINIYCRMKSEYIFRPGYFKHESGMYEVLESFRDRFEIGNVDSIRISVYCTDYDLRCDYALMRFNKKQGETK